MEATIVKNNISDKLVLKDKVFAKDFELLAESEFDNIEILSLDCFDTLLFRRVMQPADVFFDLQQSKLYRDAGINAVLRAKAESEARKINFLKSGSNEVSLIEIYKTLMPSASDEVIAEFVKEELLLESEICFAFSPVVDLMKAAIEKKLKIIIVSDTYLNQKQLSNLLQANLPNEIFNSIDHIFCSSDYGRSKNAGIFPIILNKLNCNPLKVLHLGDNEVSDFSAAKRDGIKSFHFIHLDENISKLRELNSSALCFSDQSIRSDRALNDIFHSLFAELKEHSFSTEYLLGFATLGPIMYAFSSFIINEVARLKKMGSKVKPLFLMRDAWLPFLACEQFSGEVIGHPVQISRFTAWGASFKTKADVNNYLAESLSSGRFEEMCKQLLLTENISQKICHQSRLAKDPYGEFLQIITSKKILKQIFSASNNIREKLFSHIKSETDLHAGDTVLFIDLGYSGTAQRLLAPIFKEELNIELRGCYLLQLAVNEWQKTRVGLLNPNNCDYRTLNMIVSYIALLEQICTSVDKSVVNYDKLGNPILSNVTFSDEQYSSLNVIQGAALDFIKIAGKNHFLTVNNVNEDNLRDAVLSRLTRLIFFPTKEEINCMEKFQFDLNLGTNNTFPLIDSKKSIESLIKYGANYMMFEKRSDLFRTNSPAELRSAGLEYVLSLMAQHRFSLYFPVNDLTYRQELLTIILLQSGKSQQYILGATATFDGFYSIYIPIAYGNFQIGILFGKNYQWVQLNSADLVDTAAYMTDQEVKYTVPCFDNLHFNNMQLHADNLYECTNPAAFAMFIPKDTVNKKNTAILKLVFRPVVVRGD